MELETEEGTLSERGGRTYSYYIGALFLKPLGRSFGGITGDGSNCPVGFKFAVVEEGLYDRPALLPSGSKDGDNLFVGHCNVVSL